MVATPADTPETIPEDDPTVATDGVLLDHRPPLMVSVNVIVEPTQQVEGPEIGISANDVAEMNSVNNVRRNNFFINVYLID
jgi:hypothetical protein